MSTEPVRVGDSLSEVVAGLRPEGAAPVAPAAAMGGVFGRWEEAVGPSVAAHVQPVKLDGTLLVVQVDDPAWATQVRFLEATVRERLEAVAGVRIDRLEVRVGRPR